MLPIFQDKMPIGYAGLVSDASLLDVETGYAAPGNGGVRAGTVVKIAAMDANGNKRVDLVSTSAAATGYLGAVQFSQYYCDQYGDYPINTPINVVTTGRIWVFCTDAAKSAVFGDPVGVAAPRTTSGKELTGWVEKGATTKIPGWFFTGRFETDPVGETAIAEIQIRPQLATA